MKTADGYLLNTRRGSVLYQVYIDEETPFGTPRLIKVRVLGMVKTLDRKWKPIKYPRIGSNKTSGFIYYGTQDLRDSKIYKKKENATKKLLLILEQDHKEITLYKNNLEKRIKRLYS